MRMRRPQPKEKKKPVAAIFSALERRLAPNSREMKLPEPWPKKKPTAWMKNIREKTMPIAAVDWVSI